jgi:N-acetylglucosaminyl-diphospho-decaprenol L-rhamnosyltransferase
MMSNGITCAAIIVTHNSERDIDRTIVSLLTQTVPPDQILIIDSASKDPSYLQRYADNPRITLQLVPYNTGFCEGNNRGMALVKPSCNYVVLLNPDAFLLPTFFGEAIAFMEKHARCGAMTGILLGYDREKGCPSGTYDSTGIFSTWYGKWYDRDQGRPYDPKAYTMPTELPAICGALMFCRKQALDQVALGAHQIFDPAFFMYKEDIDLSLRLSRAGWQLFLHPTLLAYHCRGWKQTRNDVPRFLRLHAAKNELRIHLRALSPIKIGYSLLKYLAVALFNV